MAACCQMSFADLAGRTLSHLCTCFRLNRQLVLGHKDSIAGDLKPDVLIINSLRDHRYIYPISQL